MSTVGWYVHHHGAGHATRFVAVASRCSTTVVGMGSGGRPPGWDGEWLDLPDDAGGVNPARDDVTAGGTLHWVPTHHDGLRRRTAAVSAWIDERRPDLVVVDVSVEMTMLARLHGVPVLVAAMRGDRASDLPHRLAYDAAAGLLAPWPAELPEPGWPQPWLDKTTHVGGISRFDDRRPTPVTPTDSAAPSGADDTAPRHVSVLWGYGGGEFDDARLEAARAATPGWTWSRAGRAADGTPRDVWADLRRADVVVTHGGQNAVAEVASAQRPAVVVAQPRPFAEQEATVRALDGAGIAVGLAGLPGPADWPRILDAALRRGGTGWTRWSDGHGAERAAACVDRIAGTHDSPDRGGRPDRGGPTR